MIPNKSNTTNGCNNTSSNCVIWQGPDLTCVDICNGDTISDVVAKLAEQLCECCGLNPTGNNAGAKSRSGGNLDIRTINQLCLEADYGKAGTIQQLVGNIIDKLCKSTGQSASDVCSCSINLPECLISQASDYLNTTDRVTSMVLNDPTTNKGYAHFIAERVCVNASAINDVRRLHNSLDGRVVALEGKVARQAKNTKLPPVILTIGGTGRPQSLESAVVATNNSLNEYVVAMGAPGDINLAITSAPSLGGRKLLSGNGTMSTVKNWVSVPRNLAQSFQNLWITMNDTRNALESIKDTVANPLCADITFDVKGTLQKNASGSVTGINLDFSGSTIPSAYNNCDVKGSKVTISDSSLNQIVKYVNVINRQNSTTPYAISTSEMGNLDLGSNYSVRIEFCASNDDNQCSEIQNFTIANETACPSLTLGTVSSDTIAYTVSNMRYPENKGYTVTVELKTNSGSLLDSRSYTTFSTNITGTFGNLKSATQYKLNTLVSKSGVPEKSDCPVQVVSTGEPACTSTIIIPSDTTWRTSEADLQSGANTLELATYNDGAAQTKWQVGFDSANNPIVVQASTTGVTGWNHQGNFINSELSTNPLAVTGLTGSPVSPSGIARTDADSGWKYIDTIKNPNNQLYYVYASINTTTHSVAQVVFACNCSGIYIDADQPVYYANKSKSVKVKLNAVGYTADSGTYTWNIASQPSHGTLAFSAGSPNKSYVEYNYKQDGTAMVGDGFTITLTNNCGTTVGTKYISIVPQEKIPYTSSQVIVFFDTNSMTSADAIKIKNSFTSVLAGFSGSAKPTLSFIAVDGSTSGDYVKHVKACIEETGSFTSAGAYGAAISMPAAGTWWTSVMNSGGTKPSYWTVAGSALPTSIHVISFVSQNSTNGTYGAATIASPTSWGGQPTTNSGVGAAQYQEDYDAVVDIISSAAPTSTWGQNAQAQANFPWLSGSIPCKVNQVVVPILNDTAAATASVTLQTAGAMQGETLLTAQEMAGLKLGLNKFRYDGSTGINLSSYIQSGIASSNIPYSVTTNGAGNTMKGLKDQNEYYNISLHAYIENGIDFDITTNPKIRTYFRGMLGCDSSSANEPKSAGAVQMVNSGTSTLRYAPADPGTNTGPGACTQAGVPANAINVYNKTGIQFDTTCKAYSTLSGATHEQSEYELIDGRFYAGAPGTSASGQRHAQYDADASSGGYWENEGACP
jgi:hypothetical protein